MIEILTYIILIALGLMGLPIFLVLGLLAFSAFAFDGTSVSAIAIEIYKIANAPTLLSIPLFTLAGYFLAESSTPKRVLRLTESLLGWLPGGVAIVAILVCAFFTAFTGASGVTIIAVGGLLYPILKSKGFSDSFSIGLVTCCGSLGLLFPPSLPIILYGLVSSTDINKLFIAGIIPGTFLVAILAMWAIYKGKSLPKAKVSFSWKECREAAAGSIGEILLPILVLGGIYSGVVTVSEAATLTLTYVIILTFVIYKDLSFKRDLIRLTTESMSLVGSILLILCSAMALTNYLVDAEVPYKLIAFLREYIHDKYTFLLLLNIFLLIVGCLMDIFSAIVVVVPLIVPVAREFGVDPIHLAMIFLTNLEIGYITPPVGINLFISSFRFKRPVTSLYKDSLPFLFLLLFALLLITYIPALSLFLVHKVW